MKLFEIYGGEKYDPEPYSITSYSSEELIRWIENNCKKYLSRIPEAKIYRGMDSNTPLGVINTNSFNRGSSNTRNYYNMWIDNDPLWSEFPKRNKSYICSSTYYGADDYGNIHIIIPSDDCRIGICPESDIWFSFTYLFKLLKMSDDTMEEVMADLVVILQNSLSVKDERAANVDWSAFVNSLKKITLDMVATVEEKENQVKGWYNAMVELNVKNLYEFFRLAFQPKLNRFELQYAHSAKFPKQQREVWVQGKVAVIDTTRIEDEELSKYLLAKNYDLQGDY